MERSDSFAGGRVALLDVNVLIALLDGDHASHVAAVRWFEANRSAGWATCPITENGFIRIMSGSTYPQVRRSAANLREILAEACRAEEHVFWPDTVSLRDRDVFLDGVTSRQTTDVYLLALAVANYGRFATFDRRVPATSLGESGLLAMELIPE